MKKDKHGYTEYGYRGLEEIKKLNEENKRLKAIIIQLKTNGNYQIEQRVDSPLGV